MRWHCPSPSSRALRASDLVRGSHLSRKAQVIGSLLSSLCLYWDHELIFLGRARLRRALIFVAPKQCQGSTESRPTLRFMESFNLQDWTRIGAMNLFFIGSQSARGLAQSKTSRKPGTTWPLLASWSAAARCRFRMNGSWRASTIYDRASGP